MKFSLSLTSGVQRPVSAAEIQDMAAQAESFGFHGVYTTDHFWYGIPLLQSVSTAALIAGATSKVKVGFCIYQLPIRHPIAAAKEMGQIDVLSGGRLVAGVGTGSSAREFKSLGLDFSQRGAMLDESLAAVTKLWTEEASSHAGVFWQFEDVCIDPKSIQDPHPPIWIGSWTGAMRPARRVAKYAAGWQASGLHSRIEELAAGWAQIENACAEIGRDPNEIGRAYVNAVVRFGVSPDDAWSKMPDISAFSDGRDYCFLGTPDDVAAKLQRLADTGIQEVAFLLGVEDQPILQTLAAEVMPRFRLGGSELTTSE